MVAYLVLLLQRWVTSFKQKANFYLALDGDSAGATNSIVIVVVGATGICGKSSCSSISMSMSSSK